MFFTIEPMINIGRPDVKLLDDGWTAVTRDRSLSAQFEHSIGITEDGCEIFTAVAGGLSTSRPIDAPAESGSRHADCPFARQRCTPAAALPADKPPRTRLARLLQRAGSGTVAPSGSHGGGFA